jgi:hypothetical protein
MTEPLRWAITTSIDVLIHRHNTRQPAGNRGDKIKRGDNNACTQIFRPPEIRQSGVEARRKRDATAEKGNTQIRKERKDSEKP